MNELENLEIEPGTGVDRARPEKRRTGGTAYISYSDLFDKRPHPNNVKPLCKGMDRLSTVLLLARLNLHLRHALQSGKKEDLIWVQGFLFKNFVDFEIEQRLKERFPSAKMDERPLFHPLQILNLIRQFLVNSESSCGPGPDQSQELRFKLGRACLIINDLLTRKSELAGISKGSELLRMKRLMSHLVPLYEIMNSASEMHLIVRPYFIFKKLLKEPAIREKLKTECRGFDIEDSFEEIAKITLSKWCDLLFSCFAYFMGRRRDALVANPEYFIINRESFISQSGVSQGEMDAFLETVSQTLDELTEALKCERDADARFDLLPLRARPLFLTVQDNFACLDTAFLAEKIHTGPLFVIDAALPPRDKKRDDLFKSWGLLFELYVDWLIGGMQNKPAAYFSFPRFTNGEQSFDALFLKDGLLVPFEFKGGFLSQRAKYSTRANELSRELDKKYVQKEGCSQLVSNIEKLFARNKQDRKELNGMSLQHVERVLPVIVVQDPVLGGPLINWWLNRRFQSLLQGSRISARVKVLPLNVVHIDEIETLVEGTEIGTMNLIYALHHRAMRDVEMRTLPQHFFLALFPHYAEGHSSRMERIFDDFKRENQAYLFPRTSTQNMPVEPLATKS